MMCKYSGLTSLLLLISSIVISLDVSAQGDLKDQQSSISINSFAGKKRVPMLFTTDAYRKEAVQLVIREANQVAKALQLPENLPITESNLTSFYISPYGISLFKKRIGNVSTSNYMYFVSVDNKLSFVNDAHLNEKEPQLMRDYSWPMSRYDTNDAYQMASQWLAAASMDVKGLNRDCELTIKPCIVRGQGTNGTFVPIYWIYWTQGGEGHGSVASVDYFAPTRSLLSLRVDDGQYILRSPVQFTNLDYLLSQTNTLQH
ncbi:MAG TPA: hypothetical protein VGI03_09300 [Verrucomicrobiae bacterium]